jgi:glutamate--cysteine ligase
MGFERYTDYALDVPMYFVYRKGTYHDVSGQSFRDFLDGKLAALPGERPTVQDWEDHLTTLFPEARLKRFIEMRGADGGPWRRLCALPALWVGLLYDQTAQDAAWDLVKHWSEDDRRMIQLAVPKQGLATPLPAAAGGGTMRDLAKRVLDIAREGLRNRASLDSFGENEVHFLNALITIVESGRTPAEDLLDKFNGPWGGQVDPVFREYAY